MIFTLACMLALSTTSSAASSVPTEPTTVCTIRSNPPNFIRKKVLLHVHYVTDNAYVMFITDEPSGKPKCVLQIQSVSLMNAPSVKTFFKAGDDICRHKKQPVVCPLTANLEVEATIVSGADGLPLVTFEKVIRYKYF